MKMKKEYLTLSLVLLALFLAGCNNAPEIISIEEIQQGESLDAVLESQWQPDRSTYGQGNFQNGKFEIIDLFNDLPPLPDDFYRPKHLLMSGRMTGDVLCNLGPEYYSQPEFIRDKWEEVGLPIYRDPDPTRWTPVGYGTFPHNMETLTVAGGSATACTFIHSSWGVQTYQGFSVRPVYPSSVKYRGEDLSLDNMEDAKKYITLTISPEEVLLKPAYFKFQPGWMQKVQVDVQIANNTPPGIYGVGFDVARASVQNTKDWATQYQELYFGYQGIGPSEPQLSMVVIVEPQT